ncbi:MAG TPA: citrate synthase [Xanthobacteraceae bacterium]|nr:citrate synthase [Xanthobacteraceae bacterium]
MEGKITTSSLYVTAEEAAELLGVSVGTVYAYVKRKNIRTQKMPGRRASRYWREDVERAMLRSGASVSSDEPSDLVRETTITAITEEGHYYRGQSAVALSETASLESIASLLWQTDQALAFPSAAPRAPSALKTILPIYNGMSAVDRAFATFPVIEFENPRSYDLSPSGYTRTAGELMRWFAALMIGRREPTSEPLHEVIASSSNEPQLYSDLVRRLLVLSADHELDPTTYAVRAVANTGATPYRTILAGFCATQGRRLAYGRIEALGRLLEEIAASATPKDVILARIRDGETVPGFGSKRYAQGDPRALALLNAMKHALDGDVPLQRLDAAISVMHDAVGLAPDLPLINLFLGKRLNLPRQEGIVGRLGRIAGWIAHAMEQYHGTALVRPRAAYIGELPRNEIST